MTEDTRETSEELAEPASGQPSSGDAPTEPPSELERAVADAVKLKDMLVRTTADFDNFRKRSRREVDDARRGGREDLLKELLPVFDNLERAIQSAQKAADVKAVIDGLGMVLKQFDGTLVRAGITRVPTIGIMFDPTLHEAIQQLESDEPPGTVVAEVQPGYASGEKLVRAAMVVVAKPREDKSTSD